MADVEPVLAAKLTGTAALALLVGTRVGPPPVRQADTMPAITYRRDGGGPLLGMTTNTGLAMPVYELSCWGRTKTEAKAVAEAVDAALSRWEDPASSPVVLDALLQDEADEYDPDTELHAVVQSWEIWIRE